MLRNAFSSIPVFQNFLEEHAPWPPRKGEGLKSPLYGSSGPTTFYFSQNSGYLKTFIQQCHVVQMVSGKATKRNVGKWSILLHCHQQASFKQLVQENPNGKECHKHNHEKHEKELTAEGFVSWEEFDQPYHSAWKTVVTKEAEKCWYPEVWNKEYHRKRICEQAWWLRRRTRAADHFTSHWQQCSRSRGTLSQLYPANSTASLCAPGHVYNFTHCSITLDIAGQWCHSEEHKRYKARIQAYIHWRIKFRVIWKHLERFNFV